MYEQSFGNTFWKSLIIYTRSHKTPAIVRLSDPQNFYNNSHLIPVTHIFHS